jgi:hypothetical protein
MSSVVIFISLLGLFTVAIFGSFSCVWQKNGVVHSKHFWLIFGLIFGSVLCVWQKNDQNDPKNDPKNDMKNGYCECSEMQTTRK